MSGGAVRGGRAYLEVFLKDQVSAGLRKVSQRLRNVSSVLRSVGSQLLGVGLGLAAPLAIAATTFASFDDAMRSVGAVTSSTQSQLASMTAVAKDLGATTSFTAVQVASLMTELGRAGFNPAQIEAMTGAVLNLSRATGTEAPTSANIMAAAIRQFGLAAGDATRIANVMTATANKTFNSVEQLGDALTYAGPVAKQFGMSFEDTLAVLGGLGNVGIQASSAGTALRRLLTLTGADAQRLKGIFGVSFVDAAGNARPLVQVLGEVNRATAGLGTAARAAKFNEAFGLLGITASGVIAESTADIAGLADELRNAEGTAARTAAEMDAGLGGTLRIIMSAAEGVAIAVGGAMAPAFGTVGTEVIAALGGLKQFVNENKSLATVVAVVAGGLVVSGGLLLALGLSASLASVAIGGLASITGLVAAVFGIFRPMVLASSAALWIKQAASTAATVALGIYSTAMTSSRVVMATFAASIGVVRIAVAGMRLMFVATAGAISLVTTTIRVAKAAMVAGAAAVKTFNLVMTFGQGVTLASVAAWRLFATSMGLSQAVVMNGVIAIKSINAAMIASRAIWASVTGAMATARAVMTLTNLQMLIARRASLASAAAMAIMTVAANGGAGAMGLLSGALAAVQAAAAGPLAPIALLAAAVVGLGALLYINRESVFDFLGNAIADLMPMIDSAGVQWREFAGSVTAWFSDVVSEAKIAWSGISAALAIGDLQAAWTIGWNAMKLVALKTFGPLQSAWNEFTTGLMSAMDGAWVAIRQAFNAGSAFIADMVFGLIGHVHSLLESIAEFDPTGLAQGLRDAIDVDTDGIRKALQEDAGRVDVQLETDKQKRDAERGADLAKQQAELAAAIDEAESAIRKTRDDAVSKAIADKEAQEPDLAVPDVTVPEADPIDQVNRQAQDFAKGDNTKKAFGGDVASTASSAVAALLAAGTGGRAKVEERVADATEKTADNTGKTKELTEGIAANVGRLGTVG